MTRTRRIVALVAGAAIAGSAVLTASTASATGPTPTGTTSLATVLTSDGNRFDTNGTDFDILTEAVLAVLAAKPNSPVSVLTQGSTPLTVFAPKDSAFRALVKDLTGKAPTSEEAAFNAVAGLGIDTVETVLLYHVVPGATLPREHAKLSNGAVLPTALAGASLTLTVKTNSSGYKYITVHDADTNDRNPVVTQGNINLGNVQIAHGIDAVLRPIDLP